MTYKRSKQKIKLLISIFFFLFVLMYTTSMVVFAYVPNGTGSGNITATAGTWSTSSQGYRITVTNLTGSTLAGPIDFVNTYPSGITAGYYLITNKLGVSSTSSAFLPSGMPLPVTTSGYDIYGNGENLKTWMMTIGTDSKYNIELILTDYFGFTDTYLADNIADMKILVEPVFWYTLVDSNYHVTDVTIYGTPTNIASATKTLNDVHGYPFPETSGGGGAYMANLSNNAAPLSLHTSFDDGDLGIYSVSSTTSYITNTSLANRSLGYGLHIYSGLDTPAVAPPATSTNVILKNEINNNVANSATISPSIPSTDVYDILWVSKPTNSTNSEIDCFQGTDPSAGDSEVDFTVNISRNATGSIDGLRVASYLHSSIPNMGNTQDELELSWFNNHSMSADSSQSLALGSITYKIKCTTCNGTGFTGVAPNRRSCSVVGCSNGKIPKESSIANFTYSAEPTYRGTDASYTINPPSSSRNSDNSYNVEVVKLDARSFTFNPVYQMQYDAVCNTTDQDIWMVANGKKTLNTPSWLQIETLYDTSTIMPWSRDVEDLGLAESVMKAGNAVAIGGDITVKLTLQYYVQDPYFTGGTSTNITPLYTTYLNEVANEMLSNAYIYSNMPYTGSQNMNYNIMTGINTVSNSSILLKSYLSGNVPMSVTYNSGVATQVLRSNGNVSGLQSASSSTVNGVSPTGTFDISGCLQNNHDSWYTEDYEGLLQVTQTMTFKITTSTNQKIPFEIYRNISDWQDTSYIFPTQTYLYNKPSNVTLPVNNKFAFGFGFKFSKSCDLGTNYFELLGKPQYLYVRGSVYDQSN